MNNQIQDQQAQVILMEASKDVSPVACKCGCHIFKQGTEVKMLSKERLSLMGLITEKDVLFTLTVFYCIKCLETFQEPKKEIILS